METRSRKRAEASPAAPSSSSSSSSSGSTSRANKRLRISASSSSSSISTRLRSSRVHEPSAAVTRMDSTSESSRSRRRGKNLGKDNSDKGKGKEHGVRIRDRDRDRDTVRSLELDMEGDVGVDEEDNHSEGGEDILHPNISSANTALQGLLRKLGAGVDDFLPSSAMGFASASHQSGRLKNILSGLRADGEEGRQVEALSQLCEMLSIGTEESLSTFSVDSFVPVLVFLLNHESNLDIMLLAARALTHLCDVLPSSCAAVVHYGAVTSLCARLLTIEYMDLAEQSLQALKKISQEHPTACLRAGALMAVLSYLDFFSTGVQRVALSTAANMCKKLPSDASDFVMEAVPLLTNLLQYHDAKVLEHTSVCLTRIAEAFVSSPDKLDELCNHGLVTQAASLISTSNSRGQSSLSTSTYTGLIKLLSMCASGSHLGAKTLLLLGISGTLKDILSGSSNCANLSVSPALSRPPEQIFEIVNLANELLPPLPQGTISLPASFSVVVKGFAVKNLSATPEKHEGTDSSGPENSAREKLLNDHPELLQQFGMDLLPVLIQIHGSSVNGAVRHKCLTVIAKLTYFSTAEMIRSLLSVTNLSSFLASLLVLKDVHVLMPALQIAEILMEKLPEIFSKMFVREGVVHAIDQLILASPPDHACVQISSAVRDSDSVPGTSSRTQRCRQRSGNPNLDGNLLEESNITAAKSISPPSSMEVPYAYSNIRLTVTACAKSLKDKYFPADPGAPEVGVTDNLLHLKNLCVKLNASCDDQSAKATGKSYASGVHLIDTCTTEEYLSGLISEMLVELGKGDGVSTFEFIGSGVVSALLNYFSCGNFSKEKIAEANLPKLRQRALERFKSFVAVALPATIAEGTVAPMTILVQKLQDGLSSLEHFPVLLCHASGPSGGSARISSRLRALSQPLKLRLSRAHEEKDLRDYSSNVALIDPLASLAAIEEFLWPRVQQGESSAGQQHLVSTRNSDQRATPTATPSPSTSIPSTACPQSTRSRSSMNIVYDARKDSSEVKSTSASKGKGKAISKPAQEELSGPQTRNAVRRRAAFDKDVEMKPVDADSTSEDEELDVFPAEIDDALVIEDDDFSDDEDDDHDDVFGDDPVLVCMPDKVHDVRLNDVAENDNIVSGTSDNQINRDNQINPSGSSGRTAAVGGLDSTDTKNGNSFGSRGAMSFAEAAMAGLGFVNGGGSVKDGGDQKGRSLFGSSSNPPKLIFTAGGKQLSRHSTICQAIRQQLDLHDDDERYAVNDIISNDGNQLWNDTFTVTYRRAEAGVSSSATFESTKSESTSSLNFDFQLHCLSLLDRILLPSDFDKSNPTYSILVLLCVLEGLNRLASSLRAQIVSDQFAGGKISAIDELSDTGARVPPDEFINSKLAPKLARQIQDALALCSGSLPSWCYQLTKTCPFLFPFEVRRQFFHSTAFGPSRALFRLQQQQGADNLGFANGREMRVGRLQRQKVRVSRNRILDSALKVMEMYSSQKTVLEVEYFGEVGTGLGPTLEFYTLLSHDLQRADLGMWRLNSFHKPSLEIDGDDQNEGKANSGPGLRPAGGNVELIQASLGLFPRPWPPSADVSDGSQFSKVMEYFRLVGRVMAKALQDGRLLDLPMSAAFYKLMLGQELDLQDILSFDAEIGKTLQELWALVCRKHYLESMNGDNRDAIDNLYFHGSPVEDLCLDFTLPGYPDYILKPGDRNVDIYNLEEYLSFVVDATIKTGIMRQIEAFKEGFNQVFDITCLQIFTPNELDYLLCGRRELWESESLADHIKFDHGYTAKSPAIVNLLEIMGDFTPQQQRAFCQFVTGAPRLPPGGLAVLNPKLTIVRKHSSTTSNGAADGAGSSESVDADLPSVMTCANYLKLPPYSTKEIMFKKLMFAISEGQGSFDLS